LIKTKIIILIYIYSTYYITCFKKSKN